MILQGIFICLLLFINSCDSKQDMTEDISSEPTSVTEINLSSFPKNYQLYARSINNKAQITVAGTIEGQVDSLITKVHKSNGVITRNAIKVQSDFSFSLEIDAILYNHTIELFTKEGGVETLVNRATHVTAGDVYVVHGQSNAWAIDYDNQYNKNDLPHSAQWIRTIGAMHVYNSTAIQPEAENTDWFQASGKAPDIRNGGPKVGLGMIGVLGMRLGINLVESQNVPIAIINGAGGGGAISYYQKSGNRNLDVPYGRLQNRLEASGLKDNIKAFIWNQGENNAGDTTAEYKNALSQLYHSLSSDYIFEKFYVIQTPPGCNASSGHQTVREAQRQFVQDTDNTRILTRHGFSLNPDQSGGNYFLSDGCHYHAHGYETLADWVSNLAAFDFYGTTADYEAPKVINVQLESSSALIIEFDKKILIQPDLNVESVLYTAKDYLFALNGERITAISALELLTGQKKIRLSLSGQSISVGDTLTHILSDNYPDTSMPYQGPWIVDAITGIGAVGFTKSIE